MWTSKTPLSGWRNCIHYSPVLHHFYRETWVRASNQCTATGWSYQLPFLSCLFSQECKRCPRGVIRSQNVPWLANEQDIVWVVVGFRWDNEIGTLSWAIHFELWSYLKKHFRLVWNYYLGYKVDWGLYTAKFKVIEAKNALRYCSVIITLMRNLILELWDEYNCILI